MHDFNKFPELTNNQMALYYFNSPHKQITESFRAKVVKVIDGDTIKVKWEERDFEFPVRFMNTAAPERNEEGGQESARWLESEILNEEVDIIIDPDNRVGKWGRILGDVHHMGMSVNNKSVMLGFAVPWEQRKEAQLPNLDQELKWP